MRLLCQAYDARIAPGKQPLLRLGQAQETRKVASSQQLLRRQLMAVLAALARLDANGHPAAIDFCYLHTRPRGA